MRSSTRFSRKTMTIQMFFKINTHKKLKLKKVKKAKSILGLNKINVKRIDLLDEENQKKYRTIEETRQLIYTD